MNKIYLAFFICVISTEALTQNSYPSSGNAVINNLLVGRYGAPIVGDNNPYNIYTVDGEAHDLMIYGSSAATLHLRLYDGDLKIGYNSTPATILYNNGNAVFGGQVGIGVANPEKTLDINGDLQIRTNTFYKGVSWQNIQNRFFSYGGNGADAQWLVHTMSDTGGRFVVTSGPVGASGSNNVAFSIEGNKNATFFGNIGIGTASPTAVLDVKGNMVLDPNGSPSIFTGTGGSELNRYLYLLNSPGSQSASGLKVGGVLVSDSYNYASPGKNDLIVKGNVGIGTPSPDAKLAVSGQIHATEVKVTIAVPGPDYVFEDDYKLTSLADIKTYIDQHKHLPEVPSAKDMEKDGIQLGEMNMLLLKKMEEMTLYMIELKKENDVLKTRIEKIETRK